jgi:hypothetical protein
MHIADFENGPTVEAAMVVNRRNPVRLHRLSFVLGHVDQKCVVSRRRTNEEMSAADPIRVLLSKEGEQRVAQCLEYDTGAQARDLGELGRRPLIAIRAERDESLRRHGKPLAGIGPASQHFHDLWLRRAGEFKPVHPAAVPDARDIEIEFGLAA